MFVICSCLHCKNNIEFDSDYAGLEIVCPHCTSATTLFLPVNPAPPSRGVVYPPSTPSIGVESLPENWNDNSSQTLPSQPTVYPQANPSPITEGYDVPPGKWSEELMSEKQKAMFILYGINQVEGLTKGQASKLIETAKQLGVRPTEENQKKADKLFAAIDRQQAKDKLKSLGKEVADGIKLIQSTRAKSSQMTELKERFEEIFAELAEAIDDRFYELDEAECEKANAEDDDD